MGAQLGLERCGGYQHKGYIGCVAYPGRRTIVLVVAFVVAIAFTFVFGYRAGRQARMIRWGNEPIHSWMSIPFIAHAHHVPPEVLYQALGVQPIPRDHRPIRRLAHDQKRPVDELIRDLNAALQQDGAHAPGPEPHSEAHPIPHSEPHSESKTP